MITTLLGTLMSVKNDAANKRRQEPKIDGEKQISQPMKPIHACRQQGDMPRELALSDVQHVPAVEADQKLRAVQVERERSAAVSQAAISAVGKNNALIAGLQRSIGNSTRSNLYRGLFINDEAGCGTRTPKTGACSPRYRS